MATDIHGVIREFLLTGAPLVALIGARAFAGRDVPPKGYDITDGACVTFRVRGGNEDYDGAMLLPSVQFKCYAETEAEADEVYRALDDKLHEGRAAGILFAQREVQGQPLEEPDTQWRYVLSFYKVQVRN